MLRLLRVTTDIFGSKSRRGWREETNTGGEFLFAVQGAGDQEQEGDRVQWEVLRQQLWIDCGRGKDDERSAECEE